MQINPFLKRITTITVLSIALILVSSFVSVPYSSKKKYENPIPETSFQGGEELTYKLYYNVNFVWVPAGEVTFTVNDIGNQWHLKAVGKTYTSYEWFYKVRDYYDTYLDKQSLLPVVSIRDIHEGKYKLYDKVVFDQTNKRAVSYRGGYSSDAKRKDLDITSYMHDLLSILYHCRNLDYDNYKKGESFPLRFFLDRQEYPINVKYKGKVSSFNVKDMGTFNTVKFSPQVVDGRVFKDGNELNVWASDDQNRIPLVVESPLSVGNIKVVLKSYKNLKYNLDSKIK